MSGWEWDRYAQSIDPIGYGGYLRGFSDEGKRRRLVMARAVADRIGQKYGPEASWPVDALAVIAELGIEHTPQWLNAAMRLCGIAHRFRYQHRVEYRAEGLIESELLVLIRTSLIRSPALSVWLTDLDERAYEAVAKRHGHAKAEGVNPYVLGSLLRSEGWELVRGNRGMRILDAELRRSLHS